MQFAWDGHLPLPGAVSRRAVRPEKGRHTFAMIARVVRAKKTKREHTGVR